MEHYLERSVETSRVESVMRAHGVNSETGNWVRNTRFDLIIPAPQTRGPHEG